ncbi:hypothetical protein B0J12DRAFT_747776 [Macrophomina phaseolina]|uniref:RING-type domain-containing protein n=1 Tax=Macrophomina phaseolina TaxID=35725 RepID=A0ABQ8FPD4_9PEZI|nr:hypothetical protein B0J12DRAFT_747776 [Macrophomina phaseolina]
MDPSMPFERSDSESQETTAQTGQLRRETRSIAQAPTLASTMNRTEAEPLQIRRSPTTHVREPREPAFSESTASLPDLIAVDPEASSATATPSANARATDPGAPLEHLGGGVPLLKALSERYGNASDPADWTSPCVICLRPFAPATATPTPPATVAHVPQPGGRSSASTAQREGNPAPASEAPCCSAPAMLPCRHVLGSACFARWALAQLPARAPSCPICRVVIVPGRSSVLGQRRNVLVQCFVLNYERAEMWRSPAKGTPFGQLMAQEERMRDWVDRVEEAKRKAQRDRRRVAEAAREARGILGLEWMREVLDVFYAEGADRWVDYGALPPVVVVILSNERKGAMGYRMRHAAVRAGCDAAVMERAVREHEAEEAGVERAMARLRAAKARCPLHEYLKSMANKQGGWFGLELFEVNILEKKYMSD